MNDIRIHRCRLRLVRHGGWSWGPDPRALLQAAIRALPALLASALAGLWPEEDEREIVAPVRLRLPLRASDLLAAQAGFSGNEAPPSGSPAAEIARRLAAALAIALAPELPQDERSEEEMEPRALDLSTSVSPAGDELGTGTTAVADLSLRHLLRAWRDRGVLAARLTLLSETTLAAWVEAWLRECQETAGARGVGSTVSDLPDLVSPGSTAASGEHAGFPSGPMRPPGESAAALRAWLVSAVEATVRHQPEGELPAAQRRDAGPLPLPPPATRRPAFSTLRTVGTTAAAKPAILQRDTEVHVVSALPFLLLGPLSRTGYLETLAATFAAVDLLDDLPLFAAALAFKALPPPERGWRRTNAALSTAAACAGLADTVASEALDGLARRVSCCLEPLAADLADSLIAGHETGRPLLLAAADDGLLLAEVDGVFPIACASEFAGLLPVLDRLGDETLLVPAGIATRALLREINASGMCFVTAAPPTRSEPWRALRLPGGDRAWTNGSATPGLARQAAGLAAAEEGAKRLWNALGVERPSLPTAADPALDRHLALAAGVALGTLAWTLWRERETVDPVLALERFGDLEARVRFSERSVRVLLPLGRRHHDLFTHRLLEPVRDAVWLGGRVLEFGGG